MNETELINYLAEDGEMFCSLPCAADKGHFKGLIQCKGRGILNEAPKECHCGRKFDRCLDGGKA